LTANKPEKYMQKWNFESQLRNFFGLMYNSQKEADKSQFMKEKIREEHI